VKAKAKAKAPKEIDPEKDEKLAKARDILCI
jgi:hypothetical protein